MNSRLATSLPRIVLAVLSILPLAPVLAWPGDALAQSDDEDVADDDEGGDANVVDDSTSDDEASDEKDDPDEKVEPTPSTQLDAPPEVPEEALQKKGAQYLLGLRYRGIVIPKFVLSAFVDGGKDVYVHGFGPELAIVDDDVEYNLSAWASLYDMSPVAIKGGGNEEEAWEIVESDLTAIYVTGDFLWKTNLGSGFDLTYGGTGGIGVLFGELYRTQAYLVDGGTPGNAGDYRPCQALDTPSFRYCDDANQHYPGYGEPSWAHGGSKPFVYPWLSGQIGFRYQPHEKLVTRLDIGVGTSGFFFGVGADYAL